MMYVLSLPSSPTNFEPAISDDCVGTLELSRKNVPRKGEKTIKLKKDELTVQHSDPVSVTT
jgi:hypothetical protein